MRIDQAEIHRKTLSNDVAERIEAAQQLGINFADLEDQTQAWDDLIRLNGDRDRDVRWEAAEALGAAFPHVLKEGAWKNLHRLIVDPNDAARLEAAKSLGKGSWNLLSHMQKMVIIWENSGINHYCDIEKP